MRPFVEMLWPLIISLGNLQWFIERISRVSTEFTARKHGGEKGVPFRLQVETYAVCASGRDVTGDDLLHCAACQIKVFKVGRLWYFSSYC